MAPTRICALLLIALTLLSLTGCWGGRETDEIAYALAVGFDKGEKDNLVVTVSIANPRSATGTAGGGGGEASGTHAVLSVETYAPIAMINLINTTIERRLSLQHAKAFVFSEELAREGLNKWTLPIIRHREVRDTASIFVCRGKAREFIEKSSPFLELSASKQYDLIARISQENGLFPSINLNEFYGSLKSESIEPTAPLAAVHEGELESAKPGVDKGGELSLGKYLAGEVPVAGKHKAQFCGTAVFRGDKMAGYLNGEETRYYLLLRGLFNSGLISILDPFAEEPAFVGFQVRQARSPKYQVNIDQDGNVSINVDIFLEPELAATTGVTTIARLDLKSTYEEALSNYIQQGCDTLVKRTQEEFRSDIFGFGYQVKHHFLTIKQWEEFDWLERYPDAQINVTVHSRIRRTGSIMKIVPPPEE